MISRVDNMLKLLKLTSEFRKVTRNVKIAGENRMENDAEHSFQIALLSWYLVETNDLPLDKNLIIQYSLIHDLVETYAGDVDPYISNEKIINGKNQKENEAMEKINKLLPEFGSLSELMKNYKDKKDAESKFVYALDKILPILNTYIAADNYYSKNGITFERWLNYNKDKVKISPEMLNYFEEVAKFLEEQDWIFARQPET